VELCQNRRPFCSADFQLIWCRTNPVKPEQVITLGGSISIRQRRVQSGCQRHSSLLTFTVAILLPGGNAGFHGAHVTVAAMAGTTDAADDDIVNNQRETAGD
jgi:hypothetical protein